MVTSLLYSNCSSINDATVNKREITYLITNLHYSGESNKKGGQKGQQSKKRGRRNKKKITIGERKRRKEKEDREGKEEK